MTPPIRSLTTYPKTPTAPPPVGPPSGQGLTVAHQRYIVVDQFGYRPEMQKVAILANPVRGWNAADSYEPSPTMEVKRWSDGSVVFTGPITPWKSGAIDPASGDSGAWFDFSKLESTGLYYVYDPKLRARSHPFEIASGVYRGALAAAIKMYYFNRANVEKRPPHACVGKRCWSVAADHMGPGQDSQARSVTDRENTKTSRDLRGGWWDAGDTNKYVTFSGDAVHVLLTAFEEHPAPFKDDVGIPESGNGTPDLLDEVKVELEWLRRMQPEDLGGGVLPKVGSVDLSPEIPAESRVKSYYYPEPCSSATIVAASQFAHAALVYGKFPRHQAFVNDLKERAIRAYDFFEAHPKSDACDDGTIKAGDSDVALPIQDQWAVVAAIYLFALTGQERYQSLVRERFASLRPFSDDRWSVYEPSQGDSLLFYTSLPNADPVAKRRILELKKMQGGLLDFYKFMPENDLYRAYMRLDSYHWGSNRERAAFGNTNLDMLEHKLVPPEQEATYVERALGLLHSFHGVNPMGLVYLTNMYHLGGDECADELFHSWFQDKSDKWDNARTSELGPAPGFLTGGPNQQYCASFADHACSRSPVRNQPPGKAYVDTNTGWDPTDKFDKSWELTEPGIYYQAAYVRLVSKFVD